jgi:hypothetical protein
MSTNPTTTKRAPRTFIETMGYLPTHKERRGLVLNCQFTGNEARQLERICAPAGGVLRTVEAFLGILLTVNSEAVEQ